jgi:hypothetical protein
MSAGIPRIWDQPIERPVLNLQPAALIVRHGHALNRHWPSPFIEGLGQTTPLPEFRDIFSNSDRRSDSGFPPASHSTGKHAARITEKFSNFAKKCACLADRSVEHRSEV